MPCIYCFRPTHGRPSKAHILPESIFGDHHELVLTNGEVCRDCNNGFSSLEAQLKDRLGLIPLLVGTGRNKRGRPTTTNAPGMWGTSDPLNPRVVFNLGRRPLTTDDGKHVRPGLKVGERIELVSQGQAPDGHHFQVEYEMRVDVPVVRILAKIAFETICLHRGDEYFMDLRWHRIRAFIGRSEGERVYFMPKTLNLPEGPNGWARVPVGISILPVYVSGPSGEWIEEWLAAIRFGPSFLIDMSPENRVLPAVLAAMPAEKREAGFLKTCHGKNPLLAA